MDLSYFVQGYILGFSVATTIGVSGVLCLQNFMTGRVPVALISVLAAAIADATCAILVVLGLGVAQEFLVEYRIAFSIMTGLFLCGLGIHKILNAVKLEPMYKENITAFHALFSILFLAIIDPVSIMDFMSFCMGLTFDFSVTRNAVQFVLGLFSGSFTWWSFLCMILLCFCLEFDHMNSIFYISISYFIFFLK